MLFLSIHDSKVNGKAGLANAYSKKKDVPFPGTSYFNALYE